jgi:hypothetical protein
MYLYSDLMMSSWLRVDARKLRIDPAVMRCGLAIHCALNRVEESKDIQRLGLDLDRRPEST